jgi:hypothetical protein
VRQRYRFFDFYQSGHVLPTLAQPANFEQAAPENFLQLYATAGF